MAPAIAASQEGLAKASMTTELRCRSMKSHAAANSTTSAATMTVPLLSLTASASSNLASATASNDLKRS